MSVFELLQRFATLLDVVVYVDREDNDSARYYRRKPLQRVTEISVHSAQPSALGVTLQPIFIRDDLESPLRWTEVELPEQLQHRFNRILRRHGLRTIDLLQGRRSRFDGSLRTTRRQAVLDRQPAASRAGLWAAG